LLWSRSHLCHLYIYNIGMTLLWNSSMHNNLHVSQEKFKLKTTYYWEPASWNKTRHPIKTFSFIILNCIWRKTGTIQVSPNTSGPTSKHSCCFYNGEKRHWRYRCSTRTLSIAVMVLDILELIIVLTSTWVCIYLSSTSHILLNISLYQWGNILNRILHPVIEMAQFIQTAHDLFYSL